MFERHQHYNQLQVSGYSDEMGEQEINNCKEGDNAFVLERKGMFLEIIYFFIFKLVKE